MSADADKILLQPSGLMTSRRNSRLGHAVPVMHHQQCVSAPAQVTGKPVAVADHCLGLAGSQPVTGTAPGIVDPLRTGHLVKVDASVFRTRPQPVPGVVPRRPRRCRVERGHLGRPGG